MKELKIKIDGTIHEYVKTPISESACKTCSLEQYCRRLQGSHLCNAFDLTGKMKPADFNYGHFKTKQT